MSSATFTTMHPDKDKPITADVQRTNEAAGYRPILIIRMGGIGDSSVSIFFTEEQFQQLRTAVNKGAADGMP